MYFLMSTAGIKNQRGAMGFEFATATRIIFGSGTVQEVAPRAADIGHRAFVVTGRSVERAAPLLEKLNKQAIECVTFNVPGEPTTALAFEGVQQARQAECALVIGIGGGSVLDTGKVIAALLTNSGDLVDYLEVIGGGQQLAKAPAPYIAIPTTAGTGTEVTRNAVLASPEHGVKVSMRSPLMLPLLAVVDPALTHSMPPAVTASTGLDAITQLMEAFVSHKANPLTDGICREGLRRASHSLRRAYEDGSNKAAREDMSLASLFGGLALANAKLGAVHGFAGPLGGMFSAPHGVICARLAPYVMEANVQALQARTPGSPALARYDEVAQILTGMATARAADGIAWLQDICAALKVPSLVEFGLKEADLATVVANSEKASSMKGNPIALTGRELTEILRKAI
jgi:alcohol dehydrogenase class IV